MAQLAKHPPPLQEMQEIQVQSLGWKDFPGEGNGNLLQNSENSTDRGAWQAIVHGAAKSQVRLSTHAHTHTKMIKGCRQLYNSILLSYQQASSSSERQLL